MQALWTKKVVARKLGVSERTVNRWRRLQKLRACQVVKGGRVLFREEDVQRLLAENQS